MNYMTPYAEQLNEANETILQLKEAMQLEDVALYDGLRLTQNDGVILRALLQTNGACNRWRLIDKLDLMSRAGTIYNTEHLYMIVYRLRQKLIKFGITIKTERGVGFSMTADNKATLLALKQGAVAA